MYTYDGLWYNVFFYDVFALVCGCICLAFGFLTRHKQKDSKWCIVFGVIAIIVCAAMLIKDCRGISKQDFSISTGTIEYSNRAQRQAPFTFEYTFKTNEHEKLQTYYLDAFTLRRHLGDGFEFCENVRYRIKYEVNSHVIVGVEVLNE